MLYIKFIFILLGPGIWNDLRENAGEYLLRGDMCLGKYILRSVKQTLYIISNQCIG